MKYFTLKELLKSNTADKNGILEQYQPPNGVVDNLNALVDNILDPLREAFGHSIIVNCGYRCERVNTKVGGKSNSQHLSGQAADIDSVDNKRLFQLVQELDLPFDQLIDENNYSWIHVSYSGRHRKQIQQDSKTCI